MFHEAIEEICGNMLPLQVIPDEWTSNRIMRTFAKKLFQEHDKWLEDLTVTNRDFVDIRESEARFSVQLKDPDLTYIVLKTISTYRSLMMKQA